MRNTIITILVVFLPLMLTAKEMPPVIGPDSPLPPVTEAYPLQPIFTDDPIGETYQVGTTWYDYQHNGSTSRQIMLDNLGAVHTVWMNGLESGATNRHIYYNYFNAGAVGIPGGVQISVYRSGYTTLDLNGSNIPISFFHSTVDSSRGVCAWDVTYLAGSFLSTVFPLPSTNRGLTWPHGVVDHQGYYHAALQTNANTEIYYTRSENAGVSFAVPVAISSTTGMLSVSQTMAASPVSNKVAIVFTHPITTVSTDEDVFYFESNDGVTWNFNNAVNVTNFGQPGHPMTNSVRAWTTVNAIYDADDNLHIAYSSVPYPTFSDASIIWHWSQATGHTKIVGELEFDAVFVNNDPGVWHSCWDLPCLGMDDSGVLYCTWEQCTTPGDESAGGYGNFDVWATYSLDDGVTWMAPVNLTDTQTPGAPAGQCLSEGWPTSSRKVDSNLHILYIQDRDAGGMPQNEGTWTENPVIYQRVPVEDIMTDIEVVLTPTNPPIIIPANGGSFNFSINIANNSDNKIIFDAWTEVELPNGSMYGPLIFRPHLTLPGGGSIDRSITQNVPAGAPSGDYEFYAGVGDYGWNDWSVDHFPFEKLALSDGGAEIPVWSCSGWDQPGMSNPTTNVPTDFATLSVYPNPFNPAAEISFCISQAQSVRLSVFDISGREAAVLVDNFEAAGNHKIKFEAGNLPSGVYFFRLNAGGEIHTVKSILLK